MRRRSLLHEVGNVDYSKMYLTFISLEDDNIIYWKFYYRSSDYREDKKRISISTDNGSTWTEYTSSGADGTQVAVLNTGDKILIKGSDYPYGYLYTSNSQYTDYYYNYFGSSKKVNIEGNIISAAYADSFDSEDTIPSTNGTFLSFFRSLYVVDASNLYIPPNLRTKSLSGLFRSCIYLEKAPIININSFNTNSGSADICSYMFYGCRALTTVTIMGDFIQKNQKGTRKFRYMFYGCTNLSNINWLITNDSGISSSSDFENWMYNISTSGTFKKSPLFTINMSSYIPSGWTIVDAS